MTDLPNGYRFLKEGDIIPENYIYFDLILKKWCFNSVKSIVAKAYNKNTSTPLAISIFDELTNNLLIISAEAKRRADENIKNIASLSVEELANIIFQAIEVGDFCSHVFDKKYDPHTRIQEYTKTIEIKNKRIKELEADLKEAQLILNLAEDDLQKA